MRRDKMVTNPDFEDSKHDLVIAEELETYGNTQTGSERKTKLNDIGFRLILIPFFGIVIPIITNMIGNVSFTPWTYKLSFLYTIGLAWLVWEGNRFLLFTLQNYFDWFERPMRKIGALLLVVPFYTLPISVLLLYGWYGLFANGAVEWSKVWLATAIILICVVFIVHVYETVFLVKEAESEKLTNARLEKSKAEAELQSLKNQIDPHFIFNSLNTLSYLIDQDPAQAKVFNQRLSDMYRYILQNRDRNFVLLGEELQFVNDYFSMLVIRFSAALRLEVTVADEVKENFVILPISLQLLVENAVKHNEFSDEYPLYIYLTLSEDYIEVSNEVRVKKVSTSSGLGLRNLEERCQLLMNRSLLHSQLNDVFSIRVPIKKI